MRTCFRWFWGVFAGGLLAGLVGCAAPPAVRSAVDQPIERYALEARFGLRDKAQAYHGRILWQHGGSGNQVFVQDPFGNGVAELQDRPGGARMVLANGDTREASGAQELMAELTGVALPVANVARWLTGRSLPPDGVVLDELGRPLRFSSAGWTLQYEYPSGDSGDADQLPARVIANDGKGIELRLAIESWMLNPSP